MSHRDLVDLAQLSQFFHLPITEASKELGICVTALKKICRRHGIPRWPARKIRSLDKIIAGLEESHAQNPEDEGIVGEIDRLKKRRAELILNPSLASVADDRRITKASAKKKSLLLKDREEGYSSPDTTAVPSGGTAGGGVGASYTHHTHRMNPYPPLRSFTPAAIPVPMSNFPAFPMYTNYSNLVNQAIFPTIASVPTFLSPTIAAALTTNTPLTTAALSALTSTAPPITPASLPPPPAVLTNPSSSSSSSSTSLTTTPLAALQQQAQIQPIQQQIQEIQPIQQQIQAIQPIQPTIENTMVPTIPNDDVVPFGGHSPAMYYYDQQLQRGMRIQQLGNMLSTYYNAAASAGVSVGAENTHTKLVESAFNSNTPNYEAVSEDERSVPYVSYSSGYSSGSASDHSGSSSSYSYSSTSESDSDYYSHSHAHPHLPLTMGAIGVGVGAGVGGGFYDFGVKSENLESGYDTGGGEDAYTYSLNRTLL